MNDTEMLDWLITKMFKLNLGIVCRDGDYKLVEVDDMWAETLGIGPYPRAAICDAKQRDEDET